jgi:hypothetical protein
VARRAAGGRYAFGGDSIFVKVGCYLGRSLCSLAELVCQAGNGITLIGVDTCRSNGPEAQRDTDAHRPAVLQGGGTMAGPSQRNMIAGGFTRHGALLISSSVAASVLPQDDSLTTGPHRCAVADVFQVANGMVLRGGGSPVLSVRVATPSGSDATGFGRRTDPCRPIPGRAGQRGRGGAVADPRRTGWPRTPI